MSNKFCITLYTSLTSRTNAIWRDRLNGTENYERWKKNWEQVKPIKYRKWDCSMQSRNKECLFSHCSLLNASHWSMFGLDFYQHHMLRMKFFPVFIQSSFHNENHRQTFVILKWWSEKKKIRKRNQNIVPVVGFGHPDDLMANKKELGSVPHGNEWIAVKKPKCICRPVRCQIQLTHICTHHSICKTSESHSWRLLQKKSISSNKTERRSLSPEIYSKFISHWTYCNIVCLFYCPQDTLLSHPSFPMSR